MGDDQLYAQDEGEEEEEEEVVDRRNIDKTSSSTGLNLTNNRTIEVFFKPNIQNRTIEDQIISLLNVR